MRCRPIIRMSGYNLSYDHLADAYEFLRSALNGFSPKVGIVCGSGISTLCNILDDGKAAHEPINYNALPHFAHLKATVPGHAGRFQFGHVQNVPVVIADGRIHPYEGFSIQECCIPIWLMRKLGVTHLLLTNANGSCRPAHRLGTLVLVRDHVDLPALYANSSPYFGLRDERFWSGELGSGSRFVSLRGGYDESLQILARKIAEEQRWSVEEFTTGIYARVCGPLFETTSERRSIRNSFGVDVFGMSTTYEAAVGVVCGMKVLALSVVTETDPDYDASPPASSDNASQSEPQSCDTTDAPAAQHEATSHLDVLREAEKAVGRIITVFSAVIRSEFKDN